MSGTLFHNFVKLIPPPDEPDQFDAIALNPAYGRTIPLPHDYIEFMRVYGPGWFTDHGRPTLQILDLGGVSDKNHVIMLTELAAEANTHLPDRFPPPYPAVPGLLVWGADDNGYTFYWMIESVATNWLVAVDSRFRIETYNCGFLEFLYGNFTMDPDRRFYTNTMRSEIGYCPASRYRDSFRDSSMEG
jgi:hypothetical protein